MRLTRWPSLTLAALVAAAGGVQAQVEAPGDARHGTGALPPPREPQEAEGGGWQVPPLRLSGVLAYDFRAARAQGLGTETSHLLTANIGFNTYIYQPWFARLGGSLGLTNARSSTASVLDFGSEADASLHERIRTRDRFITGNARLDVFPQSRFPFEFHIERNDSRTDSGLASNLDFRTQNIGFSQRYRPPSGLFTLAAGYDRREQSGFGFRSSSDALNADFSTRWKANDLGVGVSHSRARTSGLADESRFTGLVAQHNYAPSGGLSVNSTVNWTRTEDELLGSASNITVLQGTSIGIWRREGSPLTMTASARGLALREDVAGSGLDSAGLSLGANYEVNPNLRLVATGAANVSHAVGGTDSSSFSGSAGATYQGDSIQFGATRYDWYGSGTLGTGLARSEGRESEQQHTITLQAGHALTRPFTVAENSILTLAANQSLAWTRTHSSDITLPEEAANAKLLVNGVSASWQLGGAERNAYARALFNDSMELGGTNARFQLFNFQLSGNLELGGYGSLSGDLTYQRTRQRSSDLFLDSVVLPGTPTRTSGASAEISYRQQRVFGVPRLRFTSRLKLAQDVQRQPGTLLSLPDRETRLWENRLDYSIGRLDTQLVLRLSEVDGRRLKSLTFRIQRTFGD